VQLFILCWWSRPFNSITTFDSGPATVSDVNESVSDHHSNGTRQRDRQNANWSVSNTSSHFFIGNQEEEEENTYEARTE